LIATAHPVRVGHVNGGAGTELRAIRVVVVSPSDVQRERDAIQRVVSELNGGVATDRGCHLSLWRWETDAWPALHLEGPQGAIDEQMKIEQADVVVGIFWRRFGTPTHDEGSGTEHELRLAWAAWREHRRPEVMIYFCTRAFSPTTREQTDQAGRVLEFQQELPHEQLSWTYRTVPQFEALARHHLTRFLLDRVIPPRPTAPTPTTVARVRFNLPPVAAAFTGREADLDAIDDALGVADRVVVTQAITGLGGVGKTQLAARYVQQRAGDYDVTAWIRAEDGGVADLAALAGHLGIAVEGLSPADVAQASLAWLTASDRRWLLVLDNVASAAQLRDLIPGGSSGRVLVTSRDRALRQFGPVLTVDVFDEPTATAYLAERAGRPADRDAARLARALGCLPLALSHAASYCQSGTCFADYLELLEALPASELFDTNPELFYERTVASTWRTSIKAAEDTAPLAREALELAAYLGPDAIPKALFAPLTDIDSASGRKRLTDALNALHRFSLATVDDESVSVHRLLQKTIRDDAAARGDTSVAQRALGVVDDAFPEDVGQPAQWPSCERLLGSVLALAEHPPGGVEAGRRLAGLLHSACEYLQHAEPGGRGLEISAAALALAQRLLDPDEPAVLALRNRHASAHHFARQTDAAIALFEPLCDDCERILGTEDLGTLTSRNNLAGAYLSAGRHNDAIAIYERLSGDYARVVGPDHLAAINARHNLASAYLAAGRSDEAIAMLEPLFDEWSRSIGPEHPYALGTRGVLGYAYLNAGRTEDAIAILEPLVGDEARLLGPEHSSALAVRHNLAGAYATAGRNEEAIAILEPLLSDRERLLGRDALDTDITRTLLADTYDAAGRADDARRLRSGD
jgi:tetratricopeptide (TPR) repeat protein